MDPNAYYELASVASIMKKTLTNEQMDFASDFRVPTLCFSDPGTGKTNTLIAGIYLLTSLYKVPASEICCISYTNNAKNEIAARYHKLCEDARRPSLSRVKFCTFSSLTNAIRADGFPMTSNCADTISSSDDFEYIKSVLAKNDVDVENSPYLVHSVSKLINKLNAGMVYDPEHLENNIDFVQSGLTIEQVETIRKEMYMRCFYSLPMPQGDIPLYALSTLIRKPDVADTYKRKYRVIIVDEFQDMSQLNLEILRRVADTLIVVGDMKQLIYAYNGATDRVCDIFLNYYPNARVCNLTKSFRCAQEIADLARDVIAPNFPPENPYNGFTGINTPAIIKTQQASSINWEDIAEEMKIADDHASKTFLILYRNNMAAIPLVEELYQRRVPFRTEYKMIMQQPYYNTLFDLMEAAIHDDDIDKAKKALKHFPEFAKQDIEYNPIIANMKHNKQKFFDAANIVRYRFDSSKVILQRMLQAKRKYDEHSTLSYIMGPVANAYEQFIYKSELYMLSEPLDYYKSLVMPYCNKTYDMFVAEEYDKLRHINECEKAGMGALLCTMHSAKGLEADAVYLLHIDEGLFPNKKVLNRTLEKGLIHSACEAIRQERNLLYTAITRAKTELHIVYDSELSELISSPRYNQYTRIEDQDTGHIEYDDLYHFSKTYNLGV